MPGSDRWCLSADIEGFGRFFEWTDPVICADREIARTGEDRALWILHELMEDVHMLGESIVPRDPIYERIFAHLMGDGFLIAFDIGNPKLERVLAFGISLMRLSALRYASIKIGISQGRVGDIQGCYPDFVQLAIEAKERVRIGRGFMTFTTVTGSGFVRARKLAEGCHGPVLVVKDAEESIPTIHGITYLRKNDLYFVDWLNSQCLVAEEVCAARRGIEPHSSLNDCLRAYLRALPQPPERWRKVAEGLLNGYALISNPDGYFELIDRQAI